MGLLQLFARGWFCGCLFARFVDCVDLLYLIVIHI